MPIAGNFLPPPRNSSTDVLARGIETNTLFRSTNATGFDRTQPFNPIYRKGRKKLDDDIGTEYCGNTKSVVVAWFALTFTQYNRIESTL